MKDMKREDYNTIEGIERGLKYYPHFHQRLEARKEAAEKGEPLNPFVVLGAFVLDAFGQFGKIEPSPRDVISDIPAVMNKRDFWEYIKGTSISDAMLSTCWSPVYLPPLNIKCAGCGKYYGTDDCHDVMVSGRNAVSLLLSDFIGRQMWEVRRYLGNNHDVARFIHPSAIIRNNRFIDERIDPYFSSTLPINKIGWVGTEEGITDSYVIQPGDETSYNEIKYFHKKCFIPWMIEESKAEFKEILDKVGFQKFTMLAAPNMYGSFEYRGAWFDVSVPEGSFTIGWRKRVIEITLHGWPVDCSKLFANESVTVDPQMVHAHSHEKAVEYLQKIRGGNGDSCWLMEELVRLF